MLPIQLLRVRTRKGAIFPLFCTTDGKTRKETGEQDAANNSDNGYNAFGLANQLIEAFKESDSKKEKRKQLESRINAIEKEYDDYKLVRGLATLLERRCDFKNALEDNQNKSADSSLTTSTATTVPGYNHPGPSSIRKLLFEESSRAGYALTDYERDNIINNIATSTSISPSFIKEFMWSDLDENMILDQFNAIRADELLNWYNLSLMQTLLFNCTKMEFSVSGGANWKSVLRQVKRLHLMYYLQEITKKEERGQLQEQEHQRQRQNEEEEKTSDDSSSERVLVCSLDGPLSLFKLTDRYGTSIAKLVPLIVSLDSTWSINAWIIRKTMSGKKIYEFKINSDETPFQLKDPSHYNGYSDNNRSTNNEDKNRNNNNNSTLYFDSLVEQKFANKFLQMANDWELVREPEPFIVSNGRAFIPDFMFEKYGRKVYLEIVGFWTKEYLERKLQKLSDLLSASSEGNNRSMDLFVAINEDLACSENSSPFHSAQTKNSGLSSVIPQARLIYYKNDSVPTKTIVDFLRKIDQEQIEKYATDPALTINFDQSNKEQEIISIEKIAKKLNIPVESAVRIAMRDNGEDYLKMDSAYFISKSKFRALSSLMGEKEITKFSEACTILSENGIPESCHAELVTLIGYDIIWQSMDANTAVIIKHK
jgi:predicted nuclease of restriction endonuclease-like RecB superfamily